MDKMKKEILQGIFSDLLDEMDKRKSGAASVTIVKNPDGKHPEGCMCDKCKEKGE